MKNKPLPPRIDEICFGFDRQTDERALTLFLQRLTSPQLLDVLVPRLKNEEITQILDLFSKLMHAHLKKQEYHRLFLDKTGSGENPDDQGEPS